MSEYETIHRQLLESVRPQFEGICSRKLSVENLERRLQRYVLNERLQRRLDQLALRSDGGGR